MAGMSQTSHGRKGVSSDVAGDALARRPQRHVPAQPLEHEPLDQLDAREEERPDEPRRDADERGAQQRPAEQLHRNRTPRRENGPPQCRACSRQIAVRPSGSQWASSSSMRHWTPPYCCLAILHICLSIRRRVA